MTRAKLLADEIVRAMPKKNPPKPPKPKEPKADEPAEPKKEEPAEPEAAPAKPEPRRSGWFPDYFGDD